MQDDAPQPADEPPRGGDAPRPADEPARGGDPVSDDESDARARLEVGEGSATDGRAGSPADPESVYELFQRGQALMRGRHNAQAAIVLERAASFEPGRASILEALGRACFNAGQHARARAVFEELLEVDPSSHYGHYALAQSLRKLDRVPEAVTHLRLACAMAPDSALYRGALERASASRGDPSPQG
jgi:tetratricopeptide (TPR) repeat protein